MASEPRLLPGSEIGESTTIDESMKEIARGCDRCARCNTEIFPGQRSAGSAGPGLLGGGLRTAASPEHASREDCINALMNMNSGQPPWRGIESSIIEALRHNGALADCDIVTGRLDR